MSERDSHQSPNAELGELEENVCRRIVDQFPANLVLARVCKGEIVQEWVGAGVAGIYGCEVEDMEDDPYFFFNVVHPADKDRMRTAFDRLVFSGEPLTEEYRVFRTDGQMRWVRQVCTAGKDRAGNVVRFIGFTTDVNVEKPPVEQILRLEQVLDGAPSAVAIGDMSGRVIYCNDACADICGRRSADEMVGMTFDNILPEELKNESEEGLPARLLAGPWSGEAMLSRGDGTVLDVSVSTNLLTEPSGTRVAIYCVLEDITERKRSEEALRKSEERYHTVADFTYDWEYWLDQDGKFLYVSPSCERITGYQPSAFFHDPSLIERIVHPDDRETFKDLLDKSRTSTEVLLADFRIIRRDGEERWIGHVCQPVIGVDGALLGRCGSNRDITQQVEARQREAKYAARMAALAEISHLFAPLHDPEEILDLAARRAGDLLDAISAAMSVDHGTGRIAHLVTHAQHQEAAAGVKEALQATELGVETTFGERGIGPRIADDMKDVSPALAEFARKAALGPGITAPVIAEGEVLCLLACLRKEGRPEFDQDDLWFLTQVASHTAAALTSARLYERQAKVAETLQRSLIPASPKLECLDVATCYFPAPGEAGVGGDFFDVIHFERDGVGIVVGDVSGKGIQAAVHTAEAKYMLRGYAHENPNPEYVVNALNEALCTYTGEFTFVTLVYALIEVDARRISYVNAGHEAPLLLCRDSHTITELKPQGPVLGIVSNQNYEARTVKLEGDDLLFCYTDGVTDVPGDGERFGQQRLAQTVLKAPHASSQELLDHVIQTVRDFGRRKQPDDQVIVVASPNV